MTEIIEATDLTALIEPLSPAAWSAFAHALARTDRVQECIAACEHALSLSDDQVVRDLLERARAALPHALTASSAA